MFTRTRPLCAPLLLLLLIAACGTPSAAPTATAPVGGAAGGVGGTATPGRPVQATTPPPATPAPASPTLPGGQKPPRPVPDQAAVAAGAPLRAILLAQLDEYEREVAKCASVGTPVISCNTTAFSAIQPRTPELAAYMNWYSFIRQCSSDGKGGYIATMMFVYSSPAELREPELLDVYVSGTPWCGQTRPATSATPRTGG